ncbi:hypothetical protein MRX96_010407 [Rhipicephalus microplus]
MELEREQSGQSCARQPLLSATVFWDPTIVKGQTVIENQTDTSIRCAVRVDPLLTESGADVTPVSSNAERIVGSLAMRPYFYDWKTRARPAPPLQKSYPPSLGQESSEPDDWTRHAKNKFEANKAALDGWLRGT